MGELNSQVIVGLTATVKRNPRQGWIRAGKLASDEATQLIIDLQKIVAEQKNHLDTLSNNAPDDTETLSQGEDEIEIEFKVSYSHKGGLDWGDPDRMISDTFKPKVSWNNLFGAAAPNLTEPQKDTKVRADIARYLRDTHNNEISELHPDYTVNSASINETLFQTIRVQLTALGLIESKMSVIKLEHGAEKQIRLLELTPYGRSQLVKIRAIYKEQPALAAK